MMPLPRPPHPCQDSPAIRLETLLTRPLPALSEPLEVASGFLPETVYLVANGQQAVQVAARGGTAYTPEELEILGEMARTCDPAEWGRRLRLIHEAKRRFHGQGEP